MSSDRRNAELSRVKSREDFVRLVKEETLRYYPVLIPERVDRAIEEYDGLREEYEDFMKTGCANIDTLIWCVRMQA